jgi:hypothetical protein
MRRAHTHPAYPWLILQRQVSFFVFCDEELRQHSCYQISSKVRNTSAIKLVEHCETVVLVHDIIDFPSDGLAHAKTPGRN